MSKNRKFPKNWDTQQIIDDICAYGAAGLGIACVVLMACSDWKTKQINKTVEQYEQSLPNYDEYKQTQSQIANYRDSLRHASK